LDLGALDFSDGGEELDEILVAGAPGQVLDVNELALGATARDAVSEGVRRNGRNVEARTGRSAAEATSSTASETATATLEAATVGSATTLEATAESATATLEGTGSTEVATTAEAAAEATTAAGKATASVAILADLEKATLPVVTVHDVDGILGILGSVEGDNTGSLGCAVRSLVDVSANDVTGLTEEILEILPADREGKLR
jgi:hypothetical protein